MIEGVTITPLKQIVDERGKIMRMLRSSDPVFISFGEIYFSMVHPGVVKGWHIHKKMILNYAVPFGMIRLVLFDDRENSKTRNQIEEMVIGSDNYCLVTVPPNVWNGFKGLGQESAIVANCASIPHDERDIERIDPYSSSIPYNWESGQP